jgi:adenylate kinase family enzyme
MSEIFECGFDLRRDDRAAASVFRAAILGNSGSGKSTLAARLAREYGARTLDLDTIAWLPGEPVVPRPVAEAIADVGEFCAAGGSWIVEGCYGRLVEATLEHGATLLFLDPGVDACIRHCRSRPWEPHKYRSKAEQDAKLAYLLDWVRGYYTRTDDLSLAGHVALFERWTGPKRRIALAN